MAITVSYSVAISSECSKGGNGQCDGIIPDEQMEQIPADAQYGITEECACPCHDGSAEFDVSTVEEMEQAHVEYNKYT